MSYIKNICRILRKVRWMKRIDREIDRYNRLKQKMNRQRFIIKQLAESYTEEFNEPMYKGE